LGFFELFILTDEFADDSHRSAGDLEVTLPSGDLKGSDQSVSCGGVEV
jgi:hypothetical protein